VPSAYPVERAPVCAGCSGRPLPPLFAGSASVASRVLALRSTALCGSLLLACVFAREARAEGKPTLSGSWSASSMSESWSYDNWVDACGPKPSPKGAGGGAVQVREQGGELSIVGAGRAWSTAECWETAPGLGRVSHSQSGGGRFWRTRCSVSNDKLRVSVTTTVQASDVSISISETAEHKATPTPELTCTANVTRSRSLSLNKRDGEEAAPSASASASPSASPPAPSASAAEPKATATTVTAPKTPPKECKNPGEPARLEVYPAKKVLRSGDRFSFRAVVLDAEGCSLSVKPTWAASPSAAAAKVTVDQTGAVAIGEGAEEGRFEIFASIGGKSVPVAVEIASPAKYDALLSSGSLEPQGPEEGAAVVIATGAVGGRKGVADDTGKERKQIFVALVALAALAFGLVGFALLRRGKRPIEEADPDADADADADAEARAEAEAGADADPEAEADTANTDEGAQDLKAPSPVKKPAGKVCPTCGARFGEEAMFCGEDGTTLVPLNG